MTPTPARASSSRGSGATSSRSSATRPRPTLPLVPRRFEVSFGTERSAPELQRGLDLGDGLTLGGKIDRIDLDPFSARGIVQDYKPGKTRALGARRSRSELRLQIPLYMLVLRDLVGIEPLGGVYRPLAGDRKARGLLRAEAREDALPGFAKNDYLDDDAFWAQVDGARGDGARLAGRIRAGDVEHDPKGGECPTWCDLWPMCRVRARMTQAPNPEQQAAIDGDGPRLRLRRRGHRQDGGARRALRARRLRPRR